MFDRWLLSGVFSDEFGWGVTLTGAARVLVYTKLTPVLVYTKLNPNPAPKEQLRTPPDDGSRRCCSHTV